jgi:hypothetical protein
MKEKIKEGKNIDRLQNIFLYVPPLLSQMNVYHNLLHCVFQIHFNIIISSIRKSAKQSPPLSLSVQNSVHMSSFRNLLKLRIVSSGTLPRLVWQRLTDFSKDHGTSFFSILGLLHHEDELYMIYKNDGKYIPVCTA